MVPHSTCFPVFVCKIEEAENILNMDAPNLQTVAATVMALNQNQGGSGGKPLLLGKAKRAQSAPTRIDNSAVCTIM